MREHERELGRRRRKSRKLSSKAPASKTHKKGRLINKAENFMTKHYGNICLASTTLTTMSVYLRIPYVSYAMASFTTLYATSLGLVKFGSIFHKGNDSIVRDMPRKLHRQAS